MLVEANTEEGLQQVINGGGQVVVLFTAPAWCSPCRQLHPHFSKAVDALPDTTFVKVDIDNAEGYMAVSRSIMGVPTMLKYVDGKLAGTVEARVAPLIVKELS